MEESKQKFWTTTKVPALKKFVKAIKDKTLTENISAQAVVYLSNLASDKSRKKIKGSASFSRGVKQLEESMDQVFRQEEADRESDDEASDDDEWKGSEDDDDEGGYEEDEGEDSEDYEAEEMTPVVIEDETQEMQNMVKKSLKRKAREKTAAAKKQKQAEEEDVSDSELIKVSESKKAPKRKAAQPQEYGNEDKDGNKGEREKKTPKLGMKRGGVKAAAAGPSGSSATPAKSKVVFVEEAPPAAEEGEATLGTTVVQGLLEKVAPVDAGDEDDDHFETHEKLVHECVVGDIFESENTIKETHNFLCKVPINTKKWLLIRPSPDGRSTVLNFQHCWDKDGEGVFIPIYKNELHNVVHALLLASSLYQGHVSREFGEMLSVAEDDELLTSAFDATMKGVGLDEDSMPTNKIRMRRFLNKVIENSKQSTVRVLIDKKKLSFAQELFARTNEYVKEKAKKPKRSQKKKDVGGGGMSE